MVAYIAERIFWIFIMAQSICCYCYNFKKLFDSFRGITTTNSFQNDIREQLDNLPRHNQALQQQKIHTVKQKNEPFYSKSFYVLYSILFLYC